MSAPRICDHEIFEHDVVWRCDSVHKTGLFCGGCKQRHDLEDMKDPGLCANCGERPAMVTLEFSIGQIEVDGKTVELHEVRHRCRECG